MSKLTRFSIFAAVSALAATLMIAAPASAQSQDPGVLPATPAQLEKVIAADTFNHRFVFVALCDQKVSSCADFQQSFTMNSALLRGGWTAGVQNMHTTEFYTLEPTTANAAALQAACSARKHASTREKDACQALQTAVAGSKVWPQIVMIDRTSGRVKRVDHSFTQTDQSRDIVGFIKK